MARADRNALNPRKTPAQGRSKVTVDAIFEATIQVLLADGLQRLTTTRVAERAGVSVGTLYQYYPNKQSLLFAVLKRHLERISQSIEGAAQSSHNKQKAIMVRQVVNAFLSAKLADVDEARALYAVASELDSLDLVVEAGNRCNAALASMLATAPDQRISDPEMTALYLFSAMTGPTRAMLEAGVDAEILETLAGQLKRLCLGYLDQVAKDLAQL
ncbi:TetR/AcrR family transcriptional regulator [Pseudomonas azotifigens]|uniref:TetR/AcrR family transcriptional regulator n=2 Tax=Stutzerimonas azotifigens TaxID=291995 RepID=A0ABR5Z7A8_9GAMM|nr:TetR/AcrR family transcriptional regulator [Stutzerimonas azotifigens]